MQGEAHGHCDVSFAPVREAFRDVLAAHPDEGCSLAVVVGGRTVVDLWGGAAGDGREWQRDTISHGWSVVKPAAALGLLQLVDAGRVDLDARVARYWPEYASYGKEDTTVRQVLSHAAGVVALREPMSVGDLCDWHETVRRIEAEAPFFVPGQGIGEQALLYGHLVGEIARRVDGRGVGERLRDDVCRPLGVDVHVGLGPEDQARCADLAGLGPAYVRESGQGRLEVYELVLGNPPGLRDGDVVNTAAWRAAEVPAVNGHESARGLADLYAALLFGPPGTVLYADLLAEATAVQASGDDVVLGSPAQWGLGFAVDETGYGMGGLGGSFGWADTSRGYAIGFVTRLMAGHDRGERLEEALWSCL